MQTSYATTSATHPLQTGLTLIRAAGGVFDFQNL
jgi:hypothetical protein